MSTRKGVKPLTKGAKRLFFESIKTIHSGVFRGYKMGTLTRNRLNAAENQLINFNKIQNSTK